MLTMNKNFKILAKIRISKEGFDIDTILHELSHHYQYQKYSPKTHHDYTFFNSRKVVDNYLKEQND